MIAADFNLEHFYRTVAVESPDAIIYAGDDGRIRFWNKAAERIFGFSAAEALERSLDIIVPEHLRARHWNGYAEVVRTGKTRYDAGDLLAVQALHKDGHTLPVEFALLPVKDPTNRVIGIVALLRGVTRVTDAGRPTYKRVVHVGANMIAVQAVRDVHSPFSMTIELVEAFHAENPKHRVGPFSWAQVTFACDAARVRDISDTSRRHEAFSFNWRGSGWLPLPAVHGFITVRPHGVLTRLTLDWQYTPPFGFGGRVLDAILGRRLIRLAVERFVSDIASFIDRRAALQLQREIEQKGSGNAHSRDAF